MKSVKVLFLKMITSCYHKRTYNILFRVLVIRIEQKPLPGKLLIEKANEAGVPNGPLLKQLKDGEDVTLDDGRIVSSSKMSLATPKKDLRLPFSEIPAIAQLPLNWREMRIF